MIAVERAIAEISIFLGNAVRILRASANTIARKTGSRLAVIIASARISVVAEADFVLVYAPDYWIAKVIRTVVAVCTGGGPKSGDAYSLDACVAKGTGVFVAAGVVIGGACTARGRVACVAGAFVAVVAIEKGSPCLACADRARIPKGADIPVFAGE